MPLLALGLDSFDTPFAGCTTHFASLLLAVAAQLGLEPIDYPWLVRLNPAAPWKTRGNGAIALLLRTGGRRDAEKLLSAAWRLAEAYAPGSRKASIAALYLEDVESLDEYLAARPRCLETLYRRAIHEIVDPGLAVTCIAKRARIYGAGRRGLVGAAAALGWDPRRDYTFELLAYREPRRWATPRRLDEHSVVAYDLRHRPVTFANYDYESSRPLIAPHGTDPVLYGVRGTDPRVLVMALEEIDAGEEPSHWTLFRSNQATNEHLRPKTLASTRPYDNVVIVAELASRPRRLPGGHTVVDVVDHTGTATLAAYRETGMLRRVLGTLEPGDVVAAAGRAKRRRGELTLNLELLSPRGREPPCCRFCGNDWVYPPLSALHHLAAPPERCLAPPPGPLKPPRGEFFTAPHRFTLE